VSSSSSSAPSREHGPLSEFRRRRRPDLLWRRSLDAVLVLPLDADEALTLAGTGPEVWDLLESPISLTDLTAELAARHDADRTVVEADVAALLDRLAVAGVVEPAP